MANSVNKIMVFELRLWEWEPNAADWMSQFHFKYCVLIFSSGCELLTERYSASYGLWSKMFAFVCLPPAFFVGFPEPTARERERERCTSFPLFGGAICVGHTSGTHYKRRKLIEAMARRARGCFRSNKSSHFLYSCLFWSRYSFSAIWLDKEHHKPISLFMALYVDREKQFMTTWNAWGLEKTLWIEVVKTGSRFFNLCAKIFGVVLINLWTGPRIMDSIGFWVVNSQDHFEIISELSIIVPLNCIINNN